MTNTDTTNTDARLTASVYINGERRDPANGQWFDSIDPATGQPYARVARGTADDIDAAVAAAHCNPSVLRCCRHTRAVAGSWRLTRARWRRPQPVL